MSTELSCQQIITMLSDYIDGLLDAETAESIWQHLQECDACMDEYETIDKIVFLLNNVTESPIPPEFNTNLKAALRKEPSVKKRRRKRTRLQFGAMAAVLTIGLFTFWAYNNIDTALPFDADMGNINAVQAPVATSGSSITAEESNEYPEAIYKARDTDTDTETTFADSNEGVILLEDHERSEQNLPARDETDKNVIPAGINPENNSSYGDFFAETIIGGSTGNKEAENVSDANNTDLSVGAGAGSSQRQSSSTVTAANPSGKLTDVSSEQETKPRVLVPELTLTEMLSRLPEKTIAADQQTDGLQSADGEKNSDVDVAKDMQMYASEDALDVGNLQLPSRANAVNESIAAAPEVAPSAMLLETTPPSLKSADDPSRSSAATGGASRSAVNDSILARYDKKLEDKLGGCDYRVLYIEIDGSKYVYRVRLISNMHGAVIDQELDFVFDSAGTAIYYADKTDTMM